MDAIRGTAGNSTRRRTGVVVALSALLFFLLPWTGPAQAAAGPVFPANLTLSIPAGKISSFGFSASSTGPLVWSASALPPGLSIDPTTGIISGRALQAQPAITYTVTATDTADGMASSTSLTMAILPSLRPPAPSVAGVIGVPLPASYQFIADGFIAPTFSLIGNPPWLGIDGNGFLTGTPTVATISPVTVTVTATDPTGMTAVASISLTVAASALTPSSQTLTGRVGATLAPAGVAFPSGSGLTYTTSPDITAATGLSLSPTTGAITGIPTKAIPTTSFVVQQRNSSTNAILGESTASVQIDGYLGALGTAIRATSGAEMTPTTPFGPAAAQSAGLVGAVTFAVTPALPSGLLLDPVTGTISGLPMTPGSAEYTFTATDSRGVRAVGTVTIAVTGSLVPATQTIAGSVAANLSSATMAITGMRAPVTYSIAPLPPGGLLFDAATGVLSGIPTVPSQTTLYTITATDALGAKATAGLTLTIAASKLSVPVIGSVTGGSQVGSLVVYFARPTSAPLGQKFTVQVYDVTGTTLITSVAALSSPATITGLVGGETYQVIVVADASLSFDAVESLPKTGVATSSATAQPVSFLTGTSSGVASTGFVNATAALGRVGITVASATQAGKASKAFGTKPPSAIRSQAPKIKVPLGSYVTIVLPDVRVKGKIQVHIKVKSTWIDLGFIKANSSGELAVPAMRSSEPGSYVIRFTPRAGRAGYIKVVFVESTSGGFGSDTTGGF